MASPKRTRGSEQDALDPNLPKAGADDFASNAPPTYAAFSPATLATVPSGKASSKRRSTILVHQKSPLLLATPPQITRALAYSHPFLLPLNKLAGLLSWTTGDPWESFLLLLVFWAVVLYGDVLIRMAGPIAVVAGLIGGMYGRRFSPLSTSGWSEPAQKDSASKKASANTTGAAKAQRTPAKGAANGSAGLGHQRANSEITNTKHQKTLDEIVETLKEFTGRCNMLLEPMIEMTDFLSTQRTPTSATTRPALTTMFIRILFCTPFWVALTLPPLRIITTRRVVLVFGTLVLSWHAKFMRVARELLWRSSTVRRLAALLTGLKFDAPMRPLPASLQATVSEAADEAASGVRKTRESELTKALRKQSHHHGHKHGGPGTAGGAGRDAGVKFTFIIYENQRRWVGLGWTTSLFAYERGAWTDEHNHAVPSKDAFELPETEEGSRMAWRWVGGSKWRVDGVPDDGKETVDYDGPDGKNGWVYYDNKWQNGRRGQDGWGRWTRRRKWYRDAELVEILDHEEPQAVIPNKDGPASEEGESPSVEPETSATPSPETTTAYSTKEERMISPIAADSKAPSINLETVHETASDAEAGDGGSGSGNGKAMAIAIQSGKARIDSKDGADSVSVHSTSSRSFFRPGSLRRKATDRSCGSSVVDKDGGKPGQRNRRASEARSEEEVSSLGLAVEMEIQGQGRGMGGWGIGDEARMSLE